MHDRGLFFDPRRRTIISVILGLVCLGAYLTNSALFRSGYYNDDAANQLMWAFMKARGLDSLPSRLYYYFAKCEWEAGRFYPLYGLVYLLFNTIHDQSWIRDIVLYKAYIIASIGLNFLLLGTFLRRLTGSWRPGLWAMLWLPAFFQFRSFYDPILSFHAFLPALLSLTLASLIFLDRFLVTRRKRALVFSVIPYAVSLLMYEITYVFGIFHVLLLWHRKVRWREAFRLAIPYGLALSVAVGGNLLARATHYQGLPDTYKARFDFQAYLLLVLKQVYAAFPLSYYLKNPHALFAGDIQLLLRRLELRDFLSLLPFLGLWIALVSGRDEFKGAKTLLPFGVALLVLPAALIGMSPTYQYLVTWGSAYLPVYIQYFGACLVGLAGMFFVLSRIRSLVLRNLVLALVGFVGAVTLLLNMQNNRIVVESRNEKEGWNLHNILFLAAKDGLFRAITERDTLVYGNALFNAYDFLDYGLVEKKHPFLQLRDVPQAELSPDGAVYVLKAWASSVDEGYALLARVTELRVEPGTLKSSAVLEDLKLFRLGARTLNSLSVTGSGVATKIAAPDNASAEALDISSLRLDIVSEAEAR